MPLRIVIVGGVAGGASAATRARRVNESAEIVLFEKGDYVSFANCGLPYHISGQIVGRQELLVTTAQALADTFRIDVQMRHEVTRIDRRNKRVEVLDCAGGQRRWEPYDKLILAPGAAPIMPTWKGASGRNVFVLRDLADMDRIKSWIDSGKPSRAVVIGAGFIGLEMVEVLSARGLDVTVIEQQPQVLPPLDPEMAAEVGAVLRTRDVKLHLGATVENLGTVPPTELRPRPKFVNGDRPSPADTLGDLIGGVQLRDGTWLETDLVLISIGVRPNSKIAAEAGLPLGQGGAIAVNEFLQTADPDIYAVGDAAEVIHVVSGQPVRVPLAGPANRNGRLAGEHAATGRAPAATPVAASAVVGCFGSVVAMTGLSEKAAEKMGIPVAASYAIRPHHAGYYPGAQTMILKLVYNPQTRRVLGAQAVGGEGADKRIDVVATAMHFGGTIDDLAGLDLVYAPQFGSAKDPVHIAAFIAQNQADGRVENINPLQEIPAGQLIDVRNADELAGGTLPGARNIPLSRLRQEMAELDRDRPVVVFCQVGQRGYNAARILSQSGFAPVYNLAGGYRMHRSRKSQRE